MSNVKYILIGFVVGCVLIAKLPQAINPAALLMKMIKGAKTKDGQLSDKPLGPPENNENSN